MNLNQLNEITQNLIEKGYGENSVLITTADPSVGPRANVEISYVTNGFDWEQGQIRIEPKNKIILKEKDRDKPICVKTKKYSANKRNYTILKCPKCDNKVRKNDNYCSRCGQRVETKIHKKCIEREK